MRLSKIARYILREMSVWTVIGLAGAVFVFLVTQLARVAPIFAGAGGEPSEIVMALLLLAVPVCGWALTPAFALAVLPVALMFIGGLKTMQVILLIVSLPILVVGVLMAISLVKSLHADH